MSTNQVGSKRKRLHLITRVSFVSPIEEILIWKSSIYQFITPSGIDDNQERIFKEIWIDVTNSVPPMSGPGKVLGSKLNEVLARLPRKAKILDFGSGKLRNTLYLLKKGYYVRAVEFGRTQSSTDQAKEKYQEAEAFGDKFDKLVFPHEFLNSELKFDLILMINVCNIMPVPAERLLVLKYCREKLTDNGLVFWYTQHGDSEYKDLCVPDFQLGDGYYMKKQQRYQTFYREFTVSEIDSIFLANGYRLNERLDAGKNQARTYRKVGNNPMDNIASIRELRRRVKADKIFVERREMGVRMFKEHSKLKLNIPNPNELSDESFYIKALRKLPTGNVYATDYHNLMAAILIKLFIPPLINPSIEYDLADGVKRIDIVMTNTGRQGFFGDLSTQFHLNAQYILIECKNYQNEIKNPEVDQLAGRFKARWGQFGILTFRQIKDEKSLLDRCKHFVEDKEPKCILCLSDNDIISMLEGRLANEAPDDFLHLKLQGIMMG